MFKHVFFCCVRFCSFVRSIPLSSQQSHFCFQNLCPDLPKVCCQVCVCMCFSVSHSSLPMIIAEVIVWVSDSERERMWKLLIYVKCVYVW